MGSDNGEDVGLAAGERVGIYVGLAAGERVGIDVGLAASKDPCGGSGNNIGETVEPTSSSSADKL